MNNKNKFIHYEILASTLTAGFMVRGGKKIYDPNVDIKDEEREKMKCNIKQNLINIGVDYYKTDIDSKRHMENIIKLKNLIQEEHRGILFEKTFRFGVAQKLLNLYLKYLWALGWINSMPPHCPMDSIISRTLEDGYKFSKSDSVDEYKKVMEKAKQTAKEKDTSISEWEMDEFLETNYSKLNF